jgi:hypothetical protein
VFHLDVVKVGWKVAMIKYACCKPMLQMFYLVVSKVDFDVAHATNDYTRMFQMHVSSVSSVFRSMLQMFYLDVSKVD